MNDPLLDELLELGCGRGGSSGLVAAFWRLCRDFPRSSVVTRAMGGRVGGNAEGFDEVGRSSGESASGEKGTVDVGEVGLLSGVGEAGFEGPRLWNLRWDSIPKNRLRSASRRVNQNVDGGWVGGALPRSSLRKGTDT